MQKKQEVNLSIVERAMTDPSISADKLRVLIDMERADLDRKAKQAFSVSMIKVQKELSAIPEDMSNNQTHSTYSSYKTILKHAKPLYIGAGFALTFYEEDALKEGEIRICIDILHEEGYIKKYHTDIPLDDRGVKGMVNKTQPHAKGSSISYGRSYLMKMIFNLSTGEIDDDGNAAGGVSLDTMSNDQQVKQIKDLWEKIGMPEEQFKKRLKKRYKTDCPRNLKSFQADELIGTLVGMVK